MSNLPSALLSALSMDLYHSSSYSVRHISLTPTLQANSCDSRKQRQTKSGRRLLIHLLFEFFNGQARFLSSLLQGKSSVMNKTRQQRYTFFCSTDCSAFCQALCSAFFFAFCQALCFAFFSAYCFTFFSTYCFSFCQAFCSVHRFIPFFIIFSQTHISYPHSAGHQL